MDEDCLLINGPFLRIFVVLKYLRERLKLLSILAFLRQ